MKTSVESKIVLGCAASLIALASMGWLSYVTTANLVDTENWVAHTQEVIATLESGLAILTDAETQQRGYLLTGDGHFFQDSKNSQTQITAWVEKIRQLTADNPQEQQRLNKLEVLIAQRLSRLNSRIKLRQEQGLQAAADAVALRQGKGLMDQIWQGVSEMRDAENQLLQRREQAAQASARTSVMVIVVAVAVAAIIGVLAILTIRRDLRLRQQAQAELDRFFALSLDFLCIASADGYFKRISPAVTDILGWSVAEFLSRPFIDFVHPDDRDATLREVERQLTTGEKVLHFENRYQCKDGSWRVLSWRSIPQPGGLMYASARDVTNQKQMEESLRQSEERARLMVESIRDYAIIMLDPDGRVVTWNDGARQIKGYAPEEIIGQHFSRFYPKEIVESGFPQMELSEAAAKGRFENEGWRVRKDGSQFWANVVVTALRNTGGQLLGFVKVTRNLTERKQHEEDVQKLNDDLQSRASQLEAANKELEAFSYSVSHDLRAPVRHIDGFVKLLDRQAGEKLDETAKRYLKIIAEAARQMGALIDDLLVFSRMGRTELRHSKVSLDALVHEAVDALQMETQGRHINWKIRKLPEVEGDPAMLRQVWINLIANAAKYSRSRNPAEIEVSCVQPSNGEHVFFVRDNGVGFDMKYADKLFGVFQRLHRADEFEGTGIGLANVRRIVSRHGGRTWAEGKIDGGATFYFSLPNQPNIPTKN